MTIGAIFKKLISPLSRKVIGVGDLDPPANKNPHRTGFAGVELIKRFEGLSLTPYICPAGVLTVGYGSTTFRGKPISDYGDLKITKD
ncbi:hypothetical protein RZS08_11610, partial [Arthrospira platensis SPKY1]|nr:hypothetical protein [Arthrospira platensis SPKY1]